MELDMTGKGKKEAQKDVRAEKKAPLLEEVSGLWGGIGSSLFRSCQMGLLLYGAWKGQQVLNHEKWSC